MFEDLFRLQHSDTLLLGAFRVEGVARQTLLHLPFLDIMYLMGTSKRMYRLIMDDPVWRAKLSELSAGDDDATQPSVREVVEVDVVDGMSSDLFRQYSDIYSYQSRICRGMNFRLVVDNLACGVNNKLALTRNGPCCSLQSIRDANWEYMFTGNQIERVDGSDSRSLSLDVSLCLNNVRMDTLVATLWFDDVIDGVHEVNVGDMTLNLMIYSSPRKGGGIWDDDSDLYRIHFPHLTLPTSVLHEYVFRTRMRRKEVRFRYVV